MEAQNRMSPLACQTQRGIGIHNACGSIVWLTRQ